MCIEDVEWTPLSLAVERLVDSLMESGRWCACNPVGFVGQPTALLSAEAELNLTGEIGAQLPTFDAGSVIPSDGSSAAGMVPPRLSPSGELDERAGTYRLSFAASGRKSEATVLMFREQSRPCLVMSPAPAVRA